MTYKVYIESVNGWPIGDWGVSAWQGFKEMGVECILFEQIEQVPLSKLNIVVACVETTHEYLRILDIQIPRPMNVPHELWSYTHRLWWTGAAHRVEKGWPMYPVFIKPAEVAKQFVPGIVREAKDAELILNGLDMNTIVLCQTVQEFLSEYRCYVYNGKLQGVSWYIGDLYHYPDIHKVEQMIEDFKHQPNGYSIDVGVTKEGRTVLIECNDGYSLGNYGLAPGKYAKLLARRWRQLTIEGVV